MTFQKKILITGGAGFVGSWLTRELVRQGHAVLVLDYCKIYSGVDKKLFDKILRFRKRSLLRGAEVVFDDYRKRGPELISRWKPDILIHLAALPLERPDDEEISKKQLTEDIELTESVVSVVKKNKVKRFVFMSSNFVYGDCPDWSTTEKAPLNPKSPYAISKATGELITKAYLDNWNIVRTASVYGFGDANLRATQIFIDKAFAGEKFWVNADALLDFVYIKDLAKGIAVTALTDRKNEEFHITGGRALPLVAFVEELKQYFPKLSYRVIGNLNDRPKRATMDNTKARLLLNWEPEYTLRKGIKEYIRYAKRYRHG